MFFFRCQQQNGIVKVIIDNCEFKLDYNQRISKYNENALMHL